MLLQWWGGASTLSDATRSHEDVKGGGADDGASMGAMLGFRSVVCVWAVCCWDLITLPNSAHVRKLKNQEGSKIYVKVRLLRILFQRGFQKSTILLAPTAELNSCKNSSQRRYGKNLWKRLGYAYANLEISLIHRKHTFSCVCLVSVRKWIFRPLRICDIWIQREWIWIGRE